MAIKKSLALNRFGSLHAGCDQATIARSKLYAGKSPIDLKRPWFSSLRVNMTPVVKAECDVAVLLDLKDNNVVAQSVNSSRRNKYGVARLRDNTRQAIGNRPASDGMPQTVGRRARFQARINLASFLCLDHDPSFGLPRLPGWNQVRVGVAGMNLHGEHLVCVKKFEEQGKAAEARSKLPHQLFSKLFHQSTDSLAL